MRTIAFFENNAIERRNLKYWDFDTMPADALPYIQHMFIHNYKRYLEEAGYQLTEVRRIPYPHLFHLDRGIGLDGHIVGIARLAS